MWSLFRKKPADYFSPAEREKICQAITEAEKKTSGEIRVFVESKTKNGDALATAREIFFKQKMNATKERNGVLVYVAVSEKKLAIYADQGIYDKVGVEFWYSQVQEMTAHFKNANYVQGMVQVIGALGEALTENFPFDRVSDANELSDEIMTGK